MNCKINSSDFPYDDFDMWDFNYFNNMYVVLFCSYFNNSFIAYGSNITSSFNLNRNFCDKYSRCFSPIITYGNNKWILCIECDYDSCIYTSDNISSLSPDSQKSIFYHGNSSKYYFNTGILIKDEYILIACATKGTLSKHTIFYTHNTFNDNCLSFKQLLFHPIGNYFLSPFFSFGGNFF